VSTLYLIRHGQASFLGEDYDVLSETGVAQARELGRLIARIGWRFDALYVGPRRRHVDTMRALGEAARAAGAALPEPIPIEELSEYPFEDMARHHFPRLLAAQPELADLLARGDGKKRPGPTTDRLKQFIGDVTTRWARGELDLPGIETFVAFRTRVRAGLDRIRREQGRQKTVAAVTSGGPIAVSVGTVLGLPDEMTWSLASVIHNGSITELRYREEEMALVGFNAIPHLLGTELVTHR
jgi:broad specificity phosphatase PhoE